MAPKILSSIFMYCTFISFSMAQTGDLCTSPLILNLNCSGTVSFGGNSSSYLNNGPNSTFLGNDWVYEIHVPAGATTLLVSVSSTTSPFYLLLKNSCTSTSSSTIRSITGATDNLTFNLSGGGPYYLWVDHINATAFNFTGTLGVITSSSPSTKGYWDWDMSGGCISPLTKPNLKVTWNGVHQSIPIVYSPTGVPGVVCGTLLFQNYSGVEGVKTITFDFGPHLTSVSPTTMSMPGIYNAGTWNASVFGNFISWTFTDDAGLGYGDNPGTPGGCFQYQFCFNMTPLSNDPIGTTINVVAYPDGRGAARNYGCCASATNCSIPGSDGPSGPISTAFEDPLLPVTIQKLKVEQSHDKNLLTWEAVINSEFEKFEIERSFDQNNFIFIGEITSVEANILTQKFSFADSKLSKECYYRLKQIDRDGSYYYSNIISASEKEFEVKIFPQPASSTLYVESSREIKEVSITGISDNKSYKLTLENGKINLDELKAGMYFIRFNFENSIVVKKIIKE